MILKISTNGKLNRQVNAVRVGSLAVHPSTDAGLRMFTITHIATGYAVCRGEPKSVMIKAAQRLNREVNWSFKTPRGALSRAEKVKRIWEDFIAKQIAINTTKLIRLS